MQNYSIVQFLSLGQMTYSSMHLIQHIDSKITFYDNGYIN